MMRRLATAAVVSAALVGGAAPAALAYTPVDTATESSTAVDAAETSADELAKTGSSGLQPAIWAGAGLLIVGGAAAGYTALRRRSNATAE